MRARLEPIVRMGWPVLAGVALGLAVGGIWTLAQPDRYRAEGRVLVSGSAEGGNAAAVRALAESNLLEQNVAQTLHLSHVPHVSAKAGAGGVFTLSVEAGSRERARQIDAEAAQVLTRLVPARFGTAHLQAALLDPAHSEGQTSPTPGRNLLAGGLLGLLAGLIGTATFVRRRPPLQVVAGSIDPAGERRLRDRIDAVTKRERALARRAGELAAREKHVGRREHELEQLEAGLQQRDAELGVTRQELAAQANEIELSHRKLEARAAEPTPSAPEPEPAPLPPPLAAPPPVNRAGRWNINELQRAVDVQSGATAEQQEEWKAYLFFLREHAASDGSLPRQFDGLIEDVFSSALDR